MTFELSVSANVSGALTAVLVSEGQTVRAGQLLATVEARPLEALVGQAGAALAEARAARRGAPAELDRSLAQLERAQSLRAGGLLSQDALDDALYQVEVRRARLAAHDQRVQRQDALLARSREDLRQTEVRAPIDGVVTRVERQVGENVIGAQSFAPTAVLALADVSSLAVVVRIHERDIERVRTGQPAEVQVDALGTQRLEATVADVGNSAPRPAPGASNRAKEFPVRLALARPSAGLRPGLSAVAEIVVAARPSVVRLPPEALVTRPAGTEEISGAFVVQDGRALFRPLRTGVEGDDHFEVEGLRVGETVVRGPYRALRTLRDGTRVQPSGDGRP